MEYTLNFIWSLVGNTFTYFTAARLSQENGEFEGPEPETTIYGPEADLRNDVICRKHPGHEEFCPVGLFNTSHLPPGYREQSWVTQVKALAELTVLLKAGKVSKGRPSHYPGTNHRFPFHMQAGTVQERAGTGFVRHVEKCGLGGERDVGGTCVCQECLDSTEAQNKKTWWRLTLVTAIHVSFDDEEVRDTKVTMFYDEKDSETFVCRGHEMADHCLEGDMCQFYVVIHGEKVAERLKKAGELFSESRRRRGPYGELAVLVSHPHGCPKQVSVGTCLESQQFSPKGEWCPQVMFTCPTCPGSSGGVVIGWSPSNGWRGYTFPHSKAINKMKGISGRGWLA